MGVRRDDSCGEKISAELSASLTYAATSAATADPSGLMNPRLLAGVTITR
jgi:hypothetical protein